MTTYTSNQKQLLREQDEVFQILSNLKNVEPYLSVLPDEIKQKVKNIECGEGYISFNVDMLGDVVLRIVNLEVPKTIKFGADNFPIPFNFWIQLVGVEQYDTRMKLTLKAEIPLMLRPMIGNKLEKGIETIADAIAMSINKR